MKKLLPPAWAVELGVCITFVLWTYVDINKGDWTGFAMDLPISILWFFFAHFSWERKDREG